MKGGNSPGGSGTIERSSDRENPLFITHTPFSPTKLNYIKTQVCFTVLQLMSKLHSSLFSVNFMVYF